MNNFQTLPCLTSSLLSCEQCASSKATRKAPWNAQLLTLSPLSSLSLLSFSLLFLCALPVLFLLTRFIALFAVIICDRSF